MPLRQINFRKGSRKEKFKNLTLFENQISDILKNKTSIKISEILRELDLNLLSKHLLQQYKEQYRFTFNFDIMLKLYLFIKLKNHKTYSKILRYLRNNEEDSLNLGFYRNKDNKILLPNYRTISDYFNHRFNNKTKQILDFIVRKIKSLSLKNNIQLDVDEIKKIKNLTKDKKKEQRKKLKEITKLVKKLVYPNIKIKMHHNSTFTIKDLLDVLVHISYTHDFTHNGSETFGIDSNIENYPNSHIMLYHFRKFKKIKELKEMFKLIFDVIFNFGKKNYRLLRRRQLDIGIDTHKIPYYGNKNDPFVIEGKQENGTTHFFKFITSTIVVSGKRFTIDVIPMHHLDSLEDLTDQIIKRVKSKINIRYVYLDRDFDKPKVINVLKRNKVKFIMPKIKSPTVKQWFDKSENTSSRIIKDFKIGEETITNLILVNDEDGIKRSFSTNLNIPEQLTHYLFKFYSKRWGIETSYRNLEQDFKPRTTSKNYHIRLFYFLFSVILYNLWVLVNLVLSLVLFGRVPNKPIVTSKLFSTILYRVVYEDPP